MSRIEDVLHADYIAQNPSQASHKRNPLRDCPSLTGTQKFNAREEIEKLNLSEAPSSMTLSDFMGWNLDQQEAEEKKDRAADDLLKDSDGKHMDKLSYVRTTNKKVSYLENLGGVRSPTSRH